MRQKISNFFVLFLFVLFLFNFHDKKEPLKTPSQKPTEKYKQTLKQDISFDYDLAVPKSGEAEDLYRKRYAKIVELAKLHQDARYGYTMSSNNKEVFAYAKPATSNEMYFVNGYLNGFVPYEVENMWIILQYLQTRLKYQLDEIGYHDRKEVWQTAKESFVKLRGDCEDHAILLADWLIGLGYDARVVAGHVKFRD